MDYAGHLHALEFVEFVLEHGTRARAVVEHQVPPDHPARVREPVRKARARRIQQQPRRLGAVGRDHDSACLLEALVAGSVEVRDARRASTGIGVDPRGVAVDADFAAPGGLRLGNHRDEGRGLGLRLARVPMAEPAMDAGRTATVVLRVDRHRRGKRVQAELACAALEQHAGGLHRQWRHRVRSRSPRLGGRGPGETGDADLPVDFRVVGLELIVGKRPVGEPSAGDAAKTAVLVEVDVVKAPVVAGEVRCCCHRPFARSGVRAYPPSVPRSRTDRHGSSAGSSQRRS